VHPSREGKGDRDMSDYAYPNKTRRVAIYHKKQVKWRNESKTGFFERRDYLNPRDQLIRAYVRESLPQSNDQPSASFANNQWVVVINYRPGINPDDVVEFEGKTLRVKYVDEFEAKKTELKLVCEEISGADEGGPRHYARWDP